MPTYVVFAKDSYNWVMLDRVRAKDAPGAIRAAQRKYAIIDSGDRRTVIGYLWSDMFLVPARGIHKVPTKVKWR